MSERDEIFKDDLMTHGWPENGPGSLDVETLYQAFKARLMRELSPEVARPFDAKIVALGFKEDPLYPNDNPMKR